MYLGLDLSLTSTGVCLLDSSGEPTYLSTIQPKKLRGAERLEFISKKVSEILSATEFVSLEGYAYHALGKVFEIGELGGVIKLLLWQNRLTPLIVTPQAVKKWSTGLGRGGKVNVGVSLYREFNISFSDDNQADAFTLAWIAKNFYGEIPKNLQTKYRSEVINSLSREIKGEKK